MPAKLRRSNKLSTQYTVPADANDSGLAGPGWIDVVDRMLAPATAESILRSAWGGDMSLLQNLFVSMMDTWAQLADDVRTVENALTSAPFDVMPYEGSDGTVSEVAKAKADLVKLAIAGLKPNAAKRELGRDGLLKHLARGSITGHAVLEILWERRDVEGEPLILPRTVVNVGPRWYGYLTNNGPLMFRDSSMSWIEFPANKFLVHVVTATDAHPSQAGRLRTLVRFWSYMNAAWQWMMQYTQRFGVPFRIATYRKESSQVRNALIQMMQNVGASGCGVFPEGTEIKFHEAGAKGQDMPQAYVIDQANKACSLVIRGEVASGGTDGNQGLGNTGAVYAGVRREAMQGYCNDATQTLQQLAEMVVRLNWGETSEMPTVVCEIPAPEDAVKNAQRDEILLRMGLTIPEKFLRQRHDIPAPSKDEAVVSTPKATAVPALAAALSAAKTAKDDQLAEAIERLLVAAINEGNAEFLEQTKEKEAA